uniref:Uncharacterized protein n=1 Tax=Arundo donax TaxID=35708 RepID=A0A0A9A9D3_ARUDO
MESQFSICCLFANCYG